MEPYRSDKIGVNVGIETGSIVTAIISMMILGFVLWIVHKISNV
ncbi:hypothetical protein [Nautilia lithotrophica]